MTSRRALIGYVVLGLLVAGLGLAFGGPLSGVIQPDVQSEVGADTTTGTSLDGTNASDGVNSDTSDAATATDAVDGANSTDDANVTELGPDEALVTIYTTDGTQLGTIRATVADEPDERYTGLSDTDSLAEDEGMLFVFPEEDTRSFVMRDMNFPLDMIFVDAEGRITEIHHAPVENGSFLTRYRGTAKWVIEVDRGWTTEHDVAVGDRIDIQR